MGTVRRTRGAIERAQLLLLFAALVSCRAAAFAQALAPAPAARVATSAHAQRFMVVAAHPLAAQAGAAILRAGGNALDAAIAAVLALNVVEPQSAGIGGGGFLLYYDARKARLHAYDGRETAPAAARPDRFLGASGAPIARREAVASGIAIGVPGLLRMLELAHRAHGRLSWSSLFAPAIRIAREGFPISPQLHEMLAADSELAHDRQARDYFYRADGSAKPVGTLLRNPALAAVLERVAARGAGVFYRGKIARDVVRAARSHWRRPSDIAESDLSSYAAREREPLCGRYRRWRICGMPPPSSGAVTLLQMLGVLERFDVAGHAPDSLAAVHLFSEAARLAYADRDAWLGDPDFVAVPVAGLLDSGYLAARAALIDSGRSMGRARAGTPRGAPIAASGAAYELASTTHIAIVDAEGNAVALTASIEAIFGSHRMVDGFLLNNELTDFSALPERDGRPVANRVAPGKRPLSAMAPTMVFDSDGRLVLTIGSPGGPLIIVYVAQALLAVLDWRLDIGRAVSLPHFGNRNGPTELEKGTALEALARPLAAIGHEVVVRPMMSGLNGIAREAGGWAGASDPRREGLAIGE